MAESRVAETACRVDIAGESLELLPERAIYWPSANALFVADLHLAKAATLRAASIPLPDAELDRDLERLSKAIKRTGVSRLVVLGDMIHHRSGRDPQTLESVAQWRATVDVEITLVEGNHDRSAGGVPRAWDIEQVPEGLVVGPFCANHFPDREIPAGLYSLAGHLHPEVRLTGRGDQAVRLPCFWFRPSGAVLPAFGSLCGGATVKPTSGDGVYGVAEEAVVELARPEFGIMSRG